MKTIGALLVAGLALLGGLLFWKNTQSYRRKSVWWRAGKSAIDMGLIVVMAARLPALLVGWCVLWITRPIQNSALKTTLAIIAGIAFGLMGAYYMEALIFFSVFAIDLVTGANCFLKYKEKYRQKEAKQRVMEACDRDLRATA